MARFALRVTTASALVLIAMSAASSALHPARAQESERSFGLCGLFNGSERLGGERGAPSGDGDRAAQVSGPDAVLRIERLESQIRQLTGTIEQLQFRNQQLESQIRRMQEEGAPRSAVQSRPQNPASPSAPPGKRGDAFDPSQNPNAPGAPHALGSMNAPAPVPSMSADASDQPVGAPAGRGAGAPLDVTTIAPPNGAVAGPSTRNTPAGGGVLATLPPSQTPRDEYDLAYGYMLRKDYALAEGAFRSFLGRYPNDRLVGDATYWLGESMFQRQRFRDAAEAFLDVSTKHESTAKAPDALLRLGQSLAALGEKEAACASLGEVLRKFPRASAGVKQGVEREQKRVHC
ncbi:MAG TPA: tol-pal system protein YbgF [Xanthobacteraceae bacterium]|nr:tol-pal system protein YbgF [Xanthobacteraceae bacterium]